MCQESSDGFYDRRLRAPPPSLWAGREGRLRGRGYWILGGVCGGQSCRKESRVPIIACAHVTVMYEAFTRHSGVLWRPCAGCRSQRVAMALCGRVGARNGRSDVIGRERREGGRSPHALARCGTCRCTCHMYMHGTYAVHNGGGRECTRARRGREFYSSRLHVPCTST